MVDAFWSDARWAVIEPFMPTNQPGPEREDDRRGKLIRNDAPTVALAAVVASWC